MSVFKNEAEGYAESLRQQASWIDGSVFTDDLDSDELRAAADFIERATPAWQPIATAPKDGSYILLYKPKYPRPFIGWLSLDGVPERDATVSGATHWQPLPPPPEAQP